uniref:Uncharacterized protein n=1 Tax=Arundo donax TaxID=35708 RepID=A0A0A9ECT0_ARUDO
MLDNLGLDTAKVEDIVDRSNVVKEKREAEEARIHKDEPAAVEEIRKKAKTMAEAAVKDIRKQEEEETAKKKAVGSEERTVTDEPGADGDAKEKEERIFKELLKEEADNCDAVQKSKIGVLLYILHVTLSRTGYLIVFDDIRVYGDDGW